MQLAITITSVTAGTRTNRISFTAEDPERDHQKVQLLHLGSDGLAVDPGIFQLAMLAVSHFGGKALAVIVKSKTCCCQCTDAVCIEYMKTLTLHREDANV